VIFEPFNLTLPPLVDPGVGGKSLSRRLDLDFTVGAGDGSGLALAELGSEDRVSRGDRVPGRRREERF